MFKTYTDKLQAFLPVYSERIILREISEEELPGIIEIVGYDEMMANSAEDAVNIFRMHMDDREQGESIHLGIALKKDNRLIGSCGFYRGFKNNHGEIGYIIKEDYRGKGYMSEGVNTLVKFGFGILGLDKIFAVTDRKNIGSVKVLLKNDFREAYSQDKALRKFILTADEYISVLN